MRKNVNAFSWIRNLNLLRERHIYIYIYVSPYLERVLVARGHKSSGLFWKRMKSPCRRCDIIKKRVMANNKSKKSVSNTDKDGGKAELAISFFSFWFFFLQVGMNECIKIQLCISKTLLRDNSCFFFFLIHSLFVCVSVLQYIQVYTQRIWWLGDGSLICMRKLAPWLLKGDQRAFPRSCREMTRVSEKHYVGEDDPLQQWRKGCKSAYFGSGDSIDNHLLQKKRGRGKKNKQKRCHYNTESNV